MGTAVGVGCAAAARAGQRVNHRGLWVRGWATQGELAGLMQMVDARAFGGTGEMLRKVKRWFLDGCVCRLGGLLWCKSSFHGVGTGCTAA